MKPLIVIPNYMSRETDMEILGECVQSIRRTVSDTVDILIIDDRSPAPYLVDVFEERYARYDFELVRKDENEGFSRTVNVGLERAIARGPRRGPDERRHRHAHARLARTARAARPTRQPALVGALLLYPNGLIQHAGLYFSRARQRLRAPLPLRAGQPAPRRNAAAVCPVTGAFQYIPAEVLETVGPYDPGFRMGYEDVDYCLRVFQAGFPCIYEPAISAIHHESLFRSRPDEKQQRWHDLSIARLRQKWADLPVAELAGGHVMDALFVAQTADASCYHRVDAAGARARLRLVRARRAAAAVARRPRQRARARRASRRSTSYEVARRADRRPRTAGWTLIAALQASGTRVLCDLDYDLHAVEGQRPRGHRAGRVAHRDVRRRDLRDAADRRALRAVQPQHARVRERDRPRRLRADPPRRTTRSTSAGPGAR